MLRSLLVVLLLAWTLPAYANEPPRFVAVGYGLRRLVSDDGISWRNEHVDPDPAHAAEKDFLLRGVAYGRGTIVAVGGSNTSRILVSTDGSKSWKDHSVKANFLGDVAFGNNLFVAVGYQRAMSSKDGTAWSAPIPLRDASWRRIVFGNGRFVATGLPSTKDPESGCVTTSTDGAKWTSTIVPGKAVPHDIAFGNGRFVIVGSQGLRETSADGITWENRVLGEKGDLLTNVIWTGKEFIASGSGRGAYTSADGAAWKRVADLRLPSRVAFANGVFAGCSSGKFSHSKDAREWKPAMTGSHLQITKILAIEDAR